MQKIDDELIKKIYRYDLSRLSLVILLDLINFASEEGKVEVYYKDLVSLSGCSEAQFYNVINELEELDIITRRKNTSYKREMIITINDNNFKKTGYNSYVDTNTMFFSKRMYAGLRAGAIRTYLYLLFRIKKQKFDGLNNKNTLSYNKSYLAISKQLNVSLRMIKIYCKELESKKIIEVGLKKDVNTNKYDVITVSKELNKKNTITVNKNGKEALQEASDLHIHWTHVIKNLCRRNNKKYDSDNLNNAAILFKQYGNIASKKKRNIYDIISNSFGLLSGDLDSRKIHSYIKSQINLDYAEAIIAY